ncbi:MAG: type II toxin-antitoxin system Phd/YefM family antitoxin [Clostridia bacterium]|nr:type II toxin-antitoxin system Phd/YefM family antitoxin [Clostridia bacterium]
MINIRPISDLRNKFTEIESAVNGGEPVFLTKNGYGSMVLLSLEQYEKLTDNIEMKLDEADRMAEVSDKRLTHDEVFNSVRGAVGGRQKI